MQAGIDTTRVHGSSGLGLSIVNHLAMIIGGNVNIASQLGRGTRVTVDLPLSSTIDEPKVSVFPGVDKDQFRGTRILVAEDNPVNQLVAVGLLETYGVITDVAENGQITI